jgi:hypothetical protein
MNPNTRKQRQINVTVIAVSGVAVALLAAGFVAAPDHGSTTAWAAVFILGIFAVVATSSDVVARDGVGTSGVVMVLMASLLVFRAYDFFMGPALVAILGSLDVRQGTDRAWIKMVFNAGMDAIAMLAATATFWTIGGQWTGGSVQSLLATACAAIVYLALNSILISIPVSISCEEPYLSVLRQGATFSLGAFPFAVLGFGLGWVYLELGAAVVPLLLVPILIARRAFSSYLELQASQEQTIETLILALEAKDPYTSGHARRVAMFAEYVGAELGFGSRRMERLRYAALMHDIGKLIVPNQLLNKPGRLTEAEFARVKRHEPVSVELLRRIDFLAPVAGDTTTEAAEAAVDGGAALIEPAIIHVADAFDAMTSTRAYRRALSQETAFSELRNGSGTQFNAQAVDALIHAIERRGELYGDGHEVDEHEWAVAPPEAGTGSAGLGDLVPEEQVAGP